MSKITSDLKIMKILKGNGYGYDLDGELKRSEAVTFIVRILGKEKDVDNNKNYYSSTIFEDVNEAEWYAPYVGYCVKKGIVNGYDDNTFKPNKTLSEKEFYKLLIKALDYSDSDYTCDNIYKKAYEVGIVTDINYAVNESIINKFTRGDVVEVIYNTLKLKKKNSEQILAFNLSDNNAVPKEIFKVLGIYSEEEEEEEVVEEEVEETEETEKVEEVNDIVDTSSFKIHKIVAINKKQIDITFTQEIDESVEMSLFYKLNKDGVLFLEGNHKNITVKKRNDTVISILLNDEELISESEYEMFIKGDLQNKEDEYINDGEESSFVFMGIDSNMNSISVDDVDILDENYIVVKFDNEIDMESALDRSNYSLEDKESTLKYSSAIDVREINEKEILVKFSNIKEKNDYYFEIENVKSYLEISDIDYKVSLRNDDFLDIEVKIEHAYAVNESLVYIYFDRKISKNSENAIIYSDNKSIFEKKVLDDSGRVLRCFVKSKYKFNDSGKEELKIIAGLYDEYKRVITNKPTFDYQKSTNDYDRPELKSAKVISSKGILLTFDQYISQTKNLDENNYSLEYEHNTNKVYIDATKVTLNGLDSIMVYFDNIPSEESEIKIEDIYDYSDQYKTDSINQKIIR
ncbi:MAG: S-layer homology domain-containing protein [Bacillota bacterium]|nr:S-layer homology domain-containing protein [Bacillota bacterium]